MEATFQAELMAGGNAQRQLNLENNRGRVGKFGSFRTLD
jgi:hypothetical protein